MEGRHTRTYNNVNLKEETCTLLSQAYSDRFMWGIFCKFIMVSKLTFKTCYMNIVQRLELWGDNHHPKWIDIIRIGLGLFLCYKGIEFLMNMSAMSGLLGTKMSFGSFTIMLLMNFVAFAHLLGGFLLVLGLLTRFACLIQIPILIGAIVLVNSSGGVFKPFSELTLSILVLLLLIYFLIVGNGPWSFKLSKEQES